MERTDRLRRRPDVIRYHYVAVGDRTVHVGLSHAGLAKAAKSDSITTVYLTDVVANRVQKVKLEKFLAWWRANYQDPNAEYKEEEVGK